MREEIKFEEGDEVEWGGVKGIVSGVDLQSKSDFYLYVDFENKQVGTFCKDGRYYDWLKEPSLKLIKKAKKSVKKWRWLYQISNGNFHMTDKHYSSEEEVGKWLRGNDKVIGIILETEKEFYE